MAVKHNLQPREEGKILWSDVVVRETGRKSYWGRKWSKVDVKKAGLVLSMHVLCLFAPFTFRWGALLTAAVLSVITGMLGITLSYHRHLSHRSFTLPKWLEYFFAYCGVLALQADPMDWVSTHRYHHQYTDTERDPHSPTQGFWFSHVDWIFDDAYLLEKCGGKTNVGDLQKQPFYRFIHHSYIAHPIALALLLYTVGGFPYVVWGTGVRTVWVYHSTWFLNSVCHLWGRRPWNTQDLSRNNWWVGLLFFGEGWHNNHHAFQYSARHGLEWWEVDMTWYVVRLLQVLGLATNVKLPSKLHMQRMSQAAAESNSAPGRDDDQGRLDSLKTVTNGPMGKE